MAQLLPLTTLVVNLQLSVVYLIRSLVTSDIQFSLIILTNIGLSMFQLKELIMKFIPPLSELEQLLLVRIHQSHSS